MYNRSDTDFKIPMEALRNVAGQLGGNLDVLFHGLKRVHKCKLAVS
jgi:hypothetical protein